MKYSPKAGIAFLLFTSPMVWGLVIFGPSYTGPITKDKVHRSLNWPGGIEAMELHPARVYSTHMDGFDHHNFDIYYKANLRQINELLSLFNRIHCLDHEVWIDRKPGKAWEVTKKKIPFNVNLSISRRHTEHDNPVQPRLKIHLADGDNLEGMLVIPEGMIVHSDLPAFSHYPSSKPARKAFYGKFVVADNQPSTDTACGLVTRMTLWQKRADGTDPVSIYLGLADQQGGFVFELSESEQQHLQQGSWYITATPGNRATTAKPSDTKVLLSSLEDTADKATPLRLPEPEYYYGRVLFQDGSPAVLKSDDEGSRMRVIVTLSACGHCQVDKEGYVKAVFSPDQIVNKHAKGRVYCPDFNNEVAVFPLKILSREKEKAEMITISRPQHPEPDITAAKPLMFEPLPGWESIILDVDPQTLQGKSLLLCFWDYNQRPSRTIIQNLIGKSTLLDGKEVMLVLIHAGTDHTASAEWLKKHNINFTTGQIKEQWPEVRFRWNVRGLPWLILTNTDHKVIAEGITDKSLEEYLN